MPPPFCWVVERCLAKEPEKRYFSTRDLARDLVAIRDRLSDLQIKRPEHRTEQSARPGYAHLSAAKKNWQAVKGQLLRKDVRLVTVTGPGRNRQIALGAGSGPRFAEQFPAGFISSRSPAVKDSGLIAFAIAQTLGLRETGGRSPLETLKEYLQSSLSSPMLLLIDNFEHVIERRRCWRSCWPSRPV